MTRKRWVQLLLAAIAVVGIFVWAFRPRPVPVEVASASRGLFEQSVDEDGKTRVRDRYVVSAPLAGQLERIRLKPGDAVQAGTPLAVLYPSAPALLDVRTVRELEERVGAGEAALAQSRAEVARAEAALDYSQSDLRRSKNLAAGGFLSPSAREQAELAVRVNSKALEAAQFAQHGARHNLEQSKAALLRARAVPDKRTGRWQIASPVNGRILRVLQESEAVVGLGTPLLEIADANDLEIVVDVLSTDATRIAPAAAVKIEAGVGKTLEGRVRLVEPAAFTKISALGIEEQRVNVIIGLASPREEWRELGDGYRVDVRIVTLSRPDALSIPVSALFREDSQWAVFVALDGKSQKRSVKVGARTPLAAWIESGLEPGEKVILYPSDSVAHGKRIEVVRGG
ncbi:MAG: efflux RND transporter periplasmic adaptor subunit [Burkholderiales bacterium]